MPYIVAHGLGQDAQSWNAVIQSLNADFDISCPDLYTLPEDKGFTYPALYRAFSSYCDQFQEPIHLCGLSLGGILALNYGLDHPGRVRSLVLIATQFKMPGVMLKIQNMIFRIMPAASFRQFGMDKSNVIRLMESMTALDFSKDVNRISCDTLVLCGERDRANIKAARMLVQSIDGAQLRLISGAGHEVNRDAPEALGHTIRSFWMSRFA